MAKIKEELLVIKVSTIHKNNGDSEDVITDELIATVEEVVAEILGSKAIVEAEQLPSE